MNEMRAIEIWSTPESELGKFSLAELQGCDGWIKEYTLSKFFCSDHYKKMSAPLKLFIMPLVRAHFGSVEVDTLMTELKCYPEWMLNAKPKVH